MSMRVLNVYGDGTILNKESDARFRMIDYGKILNEFHIQIFSDVDTVEKISENVWVHSINKNGFFRLFKVYMVCRNIIKERKVDCVVSPGPYISGFFAVLLKLRFGCKYLLSIYASNIYDTYWIKQSIPRLIYRFTVGPIPFMLADAIQTDGLETLSDLKSRFGEKVFLKIVIPKNIDAFYSFSREKNQTKETNFLFIGRMTKQKNLDFLVKILRSFENTENIFFRIIGDGKLRQDFIKEIDDLIQKGKVIYHDKLSRNQIIEEYKKSDVFILTSLYEGFARVFLEASAIGLPIITTKVSGVDNMMKDGINGYVVNQGDLKLFTERITVLHENHDLIFDLGSKNKAIFKEKFYYQLTIELQKIIFDYLEKK